MQTKITKGPVIIYLQGGGGGGGGGGANITDPPF